MANVIHGRGEILFRIDQRPVEVEYKNGLHEYRNPPNTLFAVADAARLPCPDDSFASLFSVESIYFYPNLEGTFEEVHRVLKPGGKAYLMINYYKENRFGHAWGKYIDIPLHL